MSQNRTNISSLSEISALSSVDAIVYPKDNETSDQIFENICDEIRELCDEINVQVRQKQTNITTVNTENTVIMPDMSTLLENKTSIVNKLTAHIKDSKADDFPHYRGEATMSILKMMEEESNSCRKAAEHLQKIYLENEKSMEELLQSEKFLNEIEEVSFDESGTDELLNKINAEINKEFKQCKRDAQTVINTLYPDSNFMETLGDLIERSSLDDTEDGWYEVTDPKQLPVIFFLINCGAAVANEENLKKVKLLI